jgi:beta-glucanase (GH16 family)
VKDRHKARRAVAAAWVMAALGCASSDDTPGGASPASPLDPAAAAGGAPGETGGVVPAAPGTVEGTPDLPLVPPSQPPDGPTGTLFVSDVCPVGGAQNGWGPVERDLSNGEEAESDGGPLTIANVIYAKGIGTHAPSDVAFALDARCSRFGAAVGIDDEMKNAGSARFQVWGDGALLAESAVLGGADPAELLDVDVSGVRELRLVVDPAEGNGSDHADWADATLVCAGAFEPCAPTRPAPPEYPGYQLAWADEFDVEGPPNPENWSFENGFVRNEEAQWYQPDNASVRSGFLVIEGRRERKENPNYRAGSGDWKNNRQFAEYTSSSLHSRGKQSFRFGRLEMRGRFPAYQGLWPAWWTLGNDGDWPSNGEVDILEFYGGSLHANFVVGTNTQWVGNWDAVATPLGDLGDADWDVRFHDYRMEWNDQTIVLSVDGRELNRMNLADLRNPNGQSPFVNPAYTLLNLAIGGQAGGDPSAVPFPVRYEVDYVRVYQAQ